MGIMITELFLVLLLQLPTIFASGVFVQSQNCGANWLANSISHGQEHFYINRNVVNKDTFCKTLQLYIENGCDVKDYLRSSNCGLDASLGMKKQEICLQIENGVAEISIIYALFENRFLLILSFAFYYLQLIQRQEENFCRRI